MGGFGGTGAVGVSCYLMLWRVRYLTFYQSLRIPLTFLFEKKKPLLMDDFSNVEEVMEVCLLEVLEALEVLEGLLSNALEDQVFGVLLESSYSSNLFWSRNKKHFR